MGDLIFLKVDTNKAAANNDNIFSAANRERILGLIQDELSSRYVELDPEVDINDIARIAHTRRVLRVV